MKDEEKINWLKEVLREIDQEIDFHQNRLNNLQKKKSEIMDELFKRDTVLINKISIQRTLSFYDIKTDSDLIKFVDGIFSSNRKNSVFEGKYSEAKNRVERLCCLSYVGEKTAKKVVEIIEEYEKEKF